MAAPDLSPSSHLASLLRRRLELIADHAFRDRDPAAHLESLKQASEALVAEHQRLHGCIPARLDHFLQQCSYQKALAFIEALPANQVRES